MQVYPKSWTAIYIALDNVGMWNLRSEFWARQYLGQQFYMRVYTTSTSIRDEYPVPKNALLCGRASGRHTRPLWASKQAPSSMKTKAVNLSASDFWIYLFRCFQLFMLCSDGHVWFKLQVKWPQLEVTFFPRKKEEEEGNNIFYSLCNFPKFLLLLHINVVRKLSFSTSQSSVSFI